MPETIYLLWRREHDGSGGDVFRAYRSEHQAEAAMTLLRECSASGKITVEALELQGSAAPANPYRMDEIAPLFSNLCRPPNELRTIRADTC